MGEEVFYSINVQNTADYYMIYGAITIAIVLVLLWAFVKNYYHMDESVNRAYELEGLTDLNYSGVKTGLYDYHDKLPYESTTFVSGIHDYYYPFTKVMNKDGKIFIPIPNSKMTYFESMKTFR